MLTKAFSLNIFKRYNRRMVNMDFSLTERAENAENNGT
jgi:hypothetical protein